MKTRIRCMFVCAFALSLIGGCSNYPITKQYRSQADIHVTVPVVKMDIQTYRGATVIWGGFIIGLVNDSSGSRLTVLEAPLDAEGFPQSRTGSRGRFIAFTKKFLDPIIFKNGMRVTLAGTVEGLDTQKLGEGTYAYPELKILQLRYWQYEYLPPYPSYYGSPYYGSWWYNGYWWPYDHFLSEDLFFDENWRWHRYRR